MCHIFILKSTKLFTLTTKQGGGGGGWGGGN